MATKLYPNFKSSMVLESIPISSSPNWLQTHLHTSPRHSLANVFQFPPWYPPSIFSSKHCHSPLVVVLWTLFVTNSRNHQWLSAILQPLPLLVSPQTIGVAISHHSCPLLIVVVFWPPSVVNCHRSTIHSAPYLILHSHVFVHNSIWQT